MNDKKSNKFEMTDTFIANPSSSPVYNDCRKGSTFWLQYDCIMDDNEMESKKSTALLAVVIGTLICMLFSTTIYYLRQQGKI